MYFLIAILTISIFLISLYILRIILLTALGFKHLDFSFEVGSEEKHTVRFYENVLFSMIQLFVDDEVKFSIFKFSRGNANYYLEVGKDEKHSIEFSYKSPLVSFAPRACTVFIDGKAYKTFHPDK